mmetsp:Transcript_15466/g.38958  ORF Transcript_15466/g.38958 Transcript_15466/m.38958 type:complete len:280 (+) Transcript_15466:492-1331(+)
MLKVITWSTKGLLFGWPAGVPKTCVNSSLRSWSAGSVSNSLAKESIGRDPLRQLPLRRSSSMVWTLRTWNLADGPFGVLHSHMYRSLLLRASKKMQLLQSFMSQSPLISCKLRLVSCLTSLRWCGSRERMSSMRCRKREVTPREQNTSVRCLLRYGTTRAIASSSASRFFMICESLSDKAPLTRFFAGAAAPSSSLSASSLLPPAGAKPVSDSESSSLSSATASSTGTSSSLPDSSTARWRSRRILSTCAARLSLRFIVLRRAYAARLRLAQSGLLAAG